MLRSFTVFLISAMSTFAGPIYSVAVLQGPTGWTSLSMQGIDDAGQVAGQGMNGADLQAFIASPAGAAAVPLPTGWTSENSSGINEAGQIVGDGGSLSIHTQAFIATASSITTIPISSGFSGSFGYGINDSGQVTGTAGNFVTFLPYVGTTAGMTAVPLPVGATYGSAIAINDSGEVVGDGYSGSGVGATYLPFIGTAGGIAPIPTISGWTDVSAEAINSSGLVAGWGYYSASDFEPFIGTAAGVTAIPLPSGSASSSVQEGSLNDAGVLVGDSTLGGWIWTASGGTQLLNLFVPAGWEISTAISISNNGLILAQGSFDDGALEYVELSASTPEPSALLLAATGLLLVCAAGCLRSGTRQRQM